MARRVRGNTGTGLEFGRSWGATQLHNHRRYDSFFNLENFSSCKIRRRTFFYALLTAVVVWQIVCMTSTIPSLSSKQRTQFVNILFKNASSHSETVLEQISGVKVASDSKEVNPSKSIHVSAADLGTVDAEIEKSLGSGIKSEFTQISKDTSPHIETDGLDSELPEANSTEMEELHSRCKCESGVPEGCLTANAAGHPVYKNIAVSSICNIKEQVTEHRRERRAAFASLAPTQHGMGSHRKRTRKRAPSEEEASSSSPSSRDAAAQEQEGRHEEEEEEEERDEKVVAVEKEGKQKTTEVLDENDEQLARLELNAAVAILTNISSMLNAEGERDMQLNNIVYTRQNHERLREARDPFRGKDPETLLSDEKDLFFPKYHKCALVGNSGILTHSFLGEAIDGHDAVLRLNQAPTRSYEHDVGARTTIRLLNKKWTHIYGKAHPELLGADMEAYTAPITPLDPGQRAPEYALVSSRGNVAEFRRLVQATKVVKVGKNHTVPLTVKPLFLSTRVVTHSTSVISTLRVGMQHAMSKRYRGGNAPSSGLLGLMLLLQRCQKITVFGFSLDECRKGGCVYPYHYFFNYVDSEWLRAHPSHSFTLEGLLLKALHKIGRICLVLDPSTITDPQGCLHPTKSQVVHTRNSLPNFVKYGKLISRTTRNIIQKDNGTYQYASSRRAQK